MSQFTPFYDRYEELTDFAKWSRIIAAGFAVGVTLRCAAVLIATFYLNEHGGTEAFGRFLAAPLATSAAFTALLYGGAYYFRRLGRYTAFYLCNIGGQSLLCFVLALVDGDAPLVYAVYALPILLSLRHTKVRALLFAFLLNLALLLLSALALGPRRPGAAPLALWDVTALALYLAGVFAVAWLLLRVLLGLVQKLKRREDQLRLDQFTQLFNHTSFYQCMDAMIGVCQRDQERSFCVVVWDIDDFKTINDHYGHDVGDKIIGLFARSLQENMGGGEFGFRYGGEEFAALTWQPLPEAVLLSNRVRERFRNLTQEFFVQECATACAGICTYDRQHQTTADALFAAADQALYQAKGMLGKDASCVWDAQNAQRRPARRRGDLIHRRNGT